MSDPDVVVIPTPGLGNSTYLVAVDGRAAAIDVPRDAWRIHDVAEQRGWRITHVLETHVHNDYLSGALELAASDEATIPPRAATTSAVSPRARASSSTWAAPASSRGQRQATRRSTSAGSCRTAAVALRRCSPAGRCSSEASGELTCWASRGWTR